MCVKGVPCIITVRMMSHYVPMYHYNTSDVSLRLKSPGAELGPLLSSPWAMTVDFTFSGLATKL